MAVSQKKLDHINKAMSLLQKYDKTSKRYEITCPVCGGVLKSKFAKEDLSTTVYCGRCSITMLVHNLITKYRLLFYRELLFTHAVNHTSEIPSVAVKYLHKRKTADGDYRPFPISYFLIN